MAEAAFIVASLSLLVGALALGWQIASWVYDGRRIRLHLVHGAVSEIASVTGKVQRNKRPMDLSSFWLDGFTGIEVVGIAVTNIGRAHVRIDRCTLHHRSGNLSLSPLGTNIGPSLPFRLPPGETETWFVSAADGRALITANNTLRKARNAEVYMSIEIGTGDTKRTRRSVALM